MIHRFALISFLAATVGACISHTPPSTGAEEVFERLSAIFSASADGADPAASFSTAEKRWRYAIGAPKCREEWGNPFYSRKVLYDASRSVAFDTGLPAGIFSASLAGVDPRDFEIAVTKVMTAEGFRESELIYVSVCGRGTCNGEQYCRVPLRREFYRARDGLMATTSINDRSYPDVGSILVQKAPSDHPCIIPDKSETACHEPGKPPR